MTDTEGVEECVQAGSTWPHAPVIPEGARVEMTDIEGGGSRERECLIPKGGMVMAVTEGYDGELDMARDSNREGGIPPEEGWGSGSTVREAKPRHGMGGWDTPGAGRTCA